MAGNKGKGAIIMNTDIYNGCTEIYVGPRKLDAESQGEVEFGKEGSKIISFTSTIAPWKARGGSEKAKGAGVKQDKQPQSSNPGGAP
jgi:hypothetical protein